MIRIRIFQRRSRSRGIRPATNAARPVGEGFEQRLGHEPFGNEVGSHARCGQSLGRARPDGRHLPAAERPGVGADLPQGAEEAGRGVGRRESHPVVVGHPPGGRPERGAPVSRVADLDYRQFDGGRPEFVEPFDES